MISRSRGPDRTAQQPLVIAQTNAGGAWYVAELSEPGVSNLSACQPRDSHFESHRNDMHEK